MLGFIDFRPNTYGRWGSILAFHSYSGQDDHRHSHYDSLEGTEPVPKHLDTFNSIIGARDAIDRSVKLIKFFVAGTKWEDGVKQFLEEDVFAITKGAQPANGDVDSNVGSCRSIASFSLEDQYIASMQQKLASLDGGFVEDLEAVRRAQAWAKHGRKLSMRRVMLVLLGLVLFVFGTILSALASRLVARKLF